MARPVKNQLHLEPLRDGGWRLHGYFRGQRVRQASRNLAKLEAAKAGMEQQLATATASEATREQLRLTWLDEGQLRDAEAATLQAKGRRLIECVAAADRVLPPVSGTKCEDALAEWLLTLKKRKRSARTEDKNELRVRAFLAFARVKFLEDIRPRMCEDWVYREQRADYTRITDAQVLRAWLNFCVKRRLLLVSPFELDMKDMSATARTVAPARILSPEQCHALRGAAAMVSGGRMLPYAILATWCFMSPQEIIRTTRAKMKLDAATPVIEVDTVKRRTAKFRTVTVPANVLPLLRAAVQDWPETRRVEFGRDAWARVREKAGLLDRAKGRAGKKKILGSVWQGSILRHTGISYLYQKIGDIREVCRQAGNTSEAAFRHYLTLPREGDAEKFYATV